MHETFVFLSNEEACYFYTLTTGKLVVAAESSSIWQTLRESERRMQELVAAIQQNLAGTTVLEDFTKEQNAWLEYRKSHLRLLFPQRVNGIAVPWGSIEKHDAAEA